MRAEKLKEKYTNSSYTDFFNLFIYPINQDFDIFPIDSGII